MLRKNINKSNLENIKFSNRFKVKKIYLSWSKLVKKKKKKKKPYKLTNMTPRYNKLLFYDKKKKCTSNKFDKPVGVVYDYEPPRTL